MRRWNFLLLMAVAMCFSFASCSSDDEPAVVEEWKNGKVLVGEQFVPATTEFTDADALKILKNGKWQYAMSYTYDSHVRLLSSYDHTNDLSVFSFSENGEGKYLMSSSADRNMSYVLENKKLKIYYENYHDGYFDYYDRIEYNELLAVDKERIVMSLDSVHFVRHNRYEPDVTTVYKPSFGDEWYRLVYVPYEEE